jgi:isochorismate synthase
MNINKNNASIFIGGGITKDSNAAKEWEETVSKSNIMKRVL